MATTHDHDELLGNELPPPAYELTDTELDRKIADAAQQSQQEQYQRPALPPLDEDGFPIWSEELFKYNEVQRQLEDESRSAKLRSEYSHAGTQPSGSSGSTSTSPPSRTLVTEPSKKENKWWFDSSTQVIAQDEVPPMQTQIIGSRPPPIQVQVGPRPHDLLAQPQSPTSDVDEDESLTVGQPSLGRAPTYYPMGQAHPGHAHPGHAQRLERHSTQTSVSSIRTMLPAFTPEAESLEGPAYEEVESRNSRRQTGQWPPVNARPQVQERVSRASVPYASATPPPVSPPPPPLNVPLHRPTAPSTYTPPVAYAPAGYTPPVALRPTTFDPSVAYRPAQNHRYTLAGRVGPDDGIIDAQRALRESGASAFYTTAVAATMQKAPAFQAPAPPPPRIIEDDNASVFSGTSAGRQSMARMSVYAPNDPTPNRMSYVPPVPTGGAYPMGYQPAPGVFKPAPPPPGAYQPMHGESSRPLPSAPGFQPMGSHMQPNAFIAPPPPPGAHPPGKKAGKLYKRL